MPKAIDTRTTVTGARTPSALSTAVQPGKVAAKFADFPKDSIGPKFVNKYMSWVETYWHDHKRYPEVEDFVTRFGWTADNIETLNKSKFWLKSLDRRGIARPGREKDQLSDRQVAAVAILMNWSDTRPPMAKLAEIGVTEEELHGWQSDPLFQQYLRRRGESALDNAAPVAQTNLLKKVSSGNLQAIKFYYEVTGQTNTQEVMNLKHLVQVILETVQKHVQDPEVLQSIASEIQAVRGLGELHN